MLYIFKKQYDLLIIRYVLCLMCWYYNSDFFFKIIKNIYFILVLCIQIFLNYL